DGANFYFLGHKYPLSFEASVSKRCRIHFEGHQWKVSLPGHLTPAERHQQIKHKLIKWYRHQAVEVFGGRLPLHADRMGVQPRKMAIRSQKRLWGNCHYSTQTIYFNWQVVMAPLEVIDYVMVHELCHLMVPNHSKRFWNKVKTYYPNHKDCQGWLKSHTMDLMLPL
ncbi:MAG: SprT family zinc-dependent metalloprotease, partial [Candidatus Omnitrophota bacterium]|nr:SprT family zinc-dependent metalloprotease [Candidatus Omnitrophota bacterium]